MPLEAPDELPGTKKDRECLRGLDFYAAGTPLNAPVILSIEPTRVKNHDWKRRFFNTMGPLTPVLTPDT